MGLLLAKPINKYDRTYMYYSEKTKPITITELNDCGYNTILHTNTFDKEENLKKYMCVNRNNRHLWKNLNSIVKMLEFSNLPRNKNTVNKTDCLCSQNLNMCIILNDSNTTNKKNFNHIVEYVSEPPGRVFLRI
jgi:hypothetical protein